MKIDGFCVPASAAGLLYLVVLGVVNYNQSPELLNSPTTGWEVLILAFLGLSLLRFLVLLIQCLLHCGSNKKGVEFVVWTALMLISGIPCYVYYYSHNRLES